MIFKNNKSTPPVKGTNYAFILFFFLNKYFNVPVPDEFFGLFNFALGILTISGLVLGAIFNIYITIIILYYKDKYNLEIKFKNYPLLIRIIKFYEKASYFNIIIESIIVFICVLTIFLASLYFILKILNKI